MIGFDQAKKLILAKADTLAPELVDVHKSLGRVLADDAQALLSLPIVPVSFRDGYVVNSEEASVGKKFKIAGNILSGNPLAETLNPGTTFSIVTEAVIPEGADAVVEEELVKRDGDFIELKESVEPGANVRQVGEEFIEGDLLAKKGTVLSEREVALLLAGGHFELEVIRRPRLWVIAAGDELRHPGSVIRAGQEYPSAGWLIAMLSEQLGCELARVILVEDTVESLLEEIPDPESADLVVTIGGTGFGQKDIIEETMGQLAAEIIFQGVKMRPAHSFTFSRKGRQVIFSLPGRIGAAEIGFELLARPGILKMQGKPELEHLLIQARVLKEISSAGDQRHILRGKIENKAGEVWVEPLHRKSWHKEMTEADGLIMVEENRGKLKPGEYVNFMLHRSRLEAMVSKKLV